MISPTARFLHYPSYTHVIRWGTSGSKRFRSLHTHTRWRGCNSTHAYDLSFIGMLSGMLDCGSGLVKRNLYRRAARKPPDNGPSQYTWKTRWDLSKCWSVGGTNPVVVPVPVEQGGGEAPGRVHVGSAVWTLKVSSRDDDFSVNHWIDPTPF